MLSPRDLLTIPLTGDDDIGDTYSDQPGVTQAQGEVGYSQGRDHRQQTGVLPDGAQGTATPGLLAANSENVYTVQYVPDGWLVTIPNVAGVNVELSQGVGAAIAPLGRFGGGGYARIAGITTSITLKSISATPCYPVVVAMSGCGALKASDVLIVPGALAQAK